MQPKYRSAGDGYRLGSPFGRNQRRGGFNRSYSSKPYTPSATKLEILMEAGRLAAEYLVSKGVLPASSLSRNLSNGSALQEFRGQGRENPATSSFNEGRIPALARLGDAGSGAAYGRRRPNDDYDRIGSRKNGRGRRRTGFYSRGYGGPDWGAERGRHGPWTERSRGYSDSMEEDDDDFAPGYGRDRRSGHEEVGSSISRVAGDEQHSKSEVVGESGSELDDTGSKASSNSTRKAALPDANADVNKGADDGKVSNAEAGEVKSSKSLMELEKNNSVAEGSDLKPDEVEEADSVSDHDINLLKLGGFPRVPTRPRSALAHRSPIDRVLSAEDRNRVDVASGGETGMTADKRPTDDSLKDSHIGDTDNPKCEEPVNSNVDENQFSKQPVDSQCEPQKSPPCSEASLDAGDKDNIVKCTGKEVVEVEKQVSPSSPCASQQNEVSQLDGATQTQSSLLIEMSSQDEEMIEAGDHLKPIPASLLPKMETGSFLRMEEVKQNQPSSFKICDLNLMEAPEITEIPDDNVLDDCHTSAPPLESEKKISVDFGLSINNKAKDTYDFNQLSGDGKVIPVIDLEDDSPMEVNDSSKSKNELIYPVENVLNHTTHSDDLPVIQDTYSLAISDYLGADIPCSPSGQADLNNLQVGMGLHGPEGFPVDDSIYGSLGDIGFMDVWDQPSQDYEKFF
ncbi:hypothetical protein Cni_G12815 [Canna indica]|uniref:Uncharacterized protein n=1 Tax=Canna indica TaxID=4628 RepID=A0AAQ3QAY6_9LILI|nr:hypothetical protein Cni_G12815 [Canna indica]